MKPVFTVRSRQSKFPDLKALKVQMEAEKRATKEQAEEKPKKLRGKSIRDAVSVSKRNSRERNARQSLPKDSPARKPVLRKGGKHKFFDGQARERTRNGDVAPVTTTYAVRDRKIIVRKWIALCRFIKKERLNIGLYSEFLDVQVARLRLAEALANIAMFSSQQQMKRNINVEPNGEPISESVLVESLVTVLLISAIYAIHSRKLVSKFVPKRSFLPSRSWYFLQLIPTHASEDYEADLFYEPSTADTELRFSVTALLAVTIAMSVLHLEYVSSLFDLACKKIRDNMNYGNMADLVIR